MLNRQDRKSTELKAIIGDFRERPPAPGDTTLREWFAGLALGNQEMMRGLAPRDMAAEAVRIADDLVRALAAPKAPSRGSMEPPSEERMNEWEAQITHDVELRVRQTVPQLPPTLPSSQQTTKMTVAATPLRKKNTSILPPPPPEIQSYQRFEPPHIVQATILPRADKPCGRYTIIDIGEDLIGEAG